MLACVTCDNEVVCACRYVGQGATDWVVELPGWGRAEAEEMVERRARGGAVVAPPPSPPLCVDADDEVTFAAAAREILAHIAATESSTGHGANSTGARL
jgi:hypothetical protein|eukprot:COSAG01_NODE_7574_length_3142_cov_2.002958_3_plen_99_part_00